MTFTAHNCLTNVTIISNNMAEALLHIGSHTHVTGPSGFTAGPTDLQDGKVGHVMFWATLTGQVRHRIATGKVKGTVAGWIEVNR